MSRDAFGRQLGAAVSFFALTPAQAELLWSHYCLLRRWNPRVNLTRVIELEAAVRVHYAESLFAASRVPQGVETVIDVGSGAGFPGFVFAVARSDWQVTLLESDQRKAAFLREASDLAPNVSVIARRTGEVLGQWDLAVSRAVKAKDVVAFARRSAGWVMLIGTEPEQEASGSGWAFTELPGGRGGLWLKRVRD